MSFVSCGPKANDKEKEKHIKDSIVAVTKLKKESDSLDNILKEKRTTDSLAEIEKNKNIGATSYQGNTAPYQTGRNTSNQPASTTNKKPEKEKKTIQINSDGGLHLGH